MDHLVLWLYFLLVASLCSALLYLRFRGTRHSIITPPPTIHHFVIHYLGRDDLPQLVCEAKHSLQGGECC